MSGDYTKNTIGLTTFNSRSCVQPVVYALYFDVLLNKFYCIRNVVQLPEYPDGRNAHENDSWVYLGVKKLIFIFQNVQLAMIQGCL